MGNGVGALLGFSVLGLTVGFNVEGLRVGCRVGALLSLFVAGLSVGCDVGALVVLVETCQKRASLAHPLRPADPVTSARCP